MNFENCILREEVSYRGGGVEISVSQCFEENPDMKVPELDSDDVLPLVKMTAYQNYLGGGLLGAVCSSCNLIGWQNHPELVALSEELKKYYHSLTNPMHDEEWEQSDYEQNQKRPSSAY